MGIYNGGIVGPFYDLAGGGDIEVLHAPTVANPIERLYPFPGAKQADTAANADAVKALGTARFEINGVVTAQIDFSSVTQSGVGALNPLVNLINAAIAAVPSFAGYNVSHSYIGGSFYFIVRNFNGNVGALSGSLVTAMGLDSVVEETHQAQSENIILPLAGEAYQELRIFGTLIMGRQSLVANFQSSLISDGEDTFSWLIAFSNTGARWEQVDSNEDTGLYTIGKAARYSSLYSDFLLNLKTGEITWDRKIPVIPAAADIYCLKSLFVLGRR